MYHWKNRKSFNKLAKYSKEKNIIKDINITKEK